MLVLATDGLGENKITISTTANEVHLAEQFCRMSYVLGSNVKAAYNCDAFVQFCDKSERAGNLKKYRKEMATVDDKSSSDSDSRLE